MATNVDITRSYIDNFSVKEYVIDDLIPYYFSEIEASKRTVGMIGMTSELISHISEDTFNSISVLFREMFPNRAILKESIFSHAAIFQLTNTTCTAAATKFILAIPEDDVVANATFTNGVGYFYIEKEMILYVEDIPFTLDYDIEIKIVKKRLSQSQEDYIFSAQYITDEYTNSISTINDPYIKLQRTADKWLGLNLTLRQCVRSVSYHKIINNTKINYPTIDIPFTGNLAGFDVLYKTADDDDYNIQMGTQIIYSQPSKNPFCYFQLTSSTNLRLSFNSKENYFQPDFNSELKVILYISKGEDGNFEKYTGDNVSVNITNERYPYSSTTSFVAAPITDYSSTGGTDSYTLSQLQAKTVMGYRTANALTTENDLEEFFDNYTWEYGSNNELKFVKRRDDVYERVYTAFIVVKKDDYIFKTRTFDLNLNINDMKNYNNTIYTMDPGTLIYYNGNDVRYKCECGAISSKTYGSHTCPLCNTSTTYEYTEEAGFNFLTDSAKNTDYYSEYIEAVNNAENGNASNDDVIWEVDQGSEGMPDYLLGRVCSFETWKSRKGYNDKLTIFDLTEDDVAAYDDPRQLQFLYVNPFLWRFNRNPNLFTLYFTTVDQSIVWDYVDQNSDSYVHFITTTANLVRKFDASRRFTLTLNVIPSVTIDSSDHPLVLEENIGNRYAVSSNDLRIIIVFKSTKLEDVAYTEMYPTAYESSIGGYTFEATFDTDDFITSDGRLRLSDGLIYRNSTNGDYYEIDPDDATVCRHYDSDGNAIVNSDGSDTESWDEVHAIISDENNGYSEYCKVVNMVANDYILIPCGDVVCSLYVLYRRVYDETIEGLRVATDTETNNKFHQYDSSFNGYIWTDEYSSTTEPFTFIKPLDTIRSPLEFKDCTTTTTTDAYDVTLSWDHTNDYNDLVTEITAHDWDKSAEHPITYNGQTYTAAIKMESTTSITFVAEKTGKLTIVSYATTENPAITIDEEDISISPNGATVIDIHEGTHVITKGTTNTFIYYLEYTYHVDGSVVYNAYPMDCSIQSLPFVAANVAIDPESMAFFLKSYIEEYNTLTSIINTKLRNASNIDVKLYNTYGNCNYFLIGEDESSTMLNTLNLKIEFDIWFTAGTNPLDAVGEIKRFIKNEIEKTNDKKMNSLYISNLIRKIELNFTYVDHLRFVTINDYPSTYQNVYNYVSDIDDLTKEERRKYVPELLNVELDDIVLNYEVLDY